RGSQVDGDIPPRVKKDAHELILDFIRSRPPLKQASERRLRPLPQKQRTLHEEILEEIKQERKLRPVPPRKGSYRSLPCIPHACAGTATSSSCMDLSAPEAGAPRPRPRVLLKAPTLAEMEEMNASEGLVPVPTVTVTPRAPPLQEEDSPCSEPSSALPLKRDRSFSERDLAQLQSELGGQEAAPAPVEPEPRPRSVLCRALVPTSAQGHTRRRVRPAGSVPASYHPVPYGTTPPPPRAALGCLEERPEDGPGAAPAKLPWLVGVTRRQDADTAQGMAWVCCCCRAKFPLFSWPAACLFCKRSVCSSCSLKMKMPSKKLAHIPVYALGFESLPGSLGAKASSVRRRDAFHSLPGAGGRRVEDEFPHMYAQGALLRDVCTDCTGFVADVVASSRRSVAALNAAPPRARRGASWHP
ncbi:SPIR2 protein, partial [Nothoprocta pentlandii]|nr:SPIR2 protein [Nothoprocta pentlandii]